MNEHIKEMQTYHKWSTPYCHPFRHSKFGPWAQARRISSLWRRYPQRPPSRPLQSSIHSPGLEVKYDTRSILAISQKCLVCISFKRPPNMFGRWHQVSLSSEDQPTVLVSVLISHPSHWPSFLFLWYDGVYFVGLPMTEGTICPGGVNVGCL